MDLSPIAEAKAFQAAIRKGASQTDLARKAGKSNGYVSYRLSLLLLPEDIQNKVDSNELEMMHARELGKAARRGAAPDHLRKLVEDASTMSLDEFRKRVNNSVGFTTRTPARRLRDDQDQVGRSRKEVVLALKVLEDDYRLNRETLTESAWELQHTVIGTLQWVLGIEGVEIPIDVKNSEGKYVPASRLSAE